MTMAMEKERTEKAPRSFSRYVEEELGRLPHFLIYAFLEWMMIVILFLDGFLSFVANRLAKFFDLKVPCLLCTRIDAHSHGDSDFCYNDSICEYHKKDVSNMAFCHNHKKLSDIRTMCEGCLLSFATQRESDCDTYKSLVGILHKDLECFVGDDPEIEMSLRDDGVQIQRSKTQKCSCCEQPLKVKTSCPKPKAPLTVSHELDPAPAPAPTPRAYPHPTFINEESRGLELPPVRCQQAKVMSEHDDSEVREDDDGSSIVNRRDTKVKEDAKAASTPLKAEADDLNDENKTPSFSKGNKFFGIPLTDASGNSPRWSYRITRSSLDKTTFTPDSTEGCRSNEGEDAISHHLNKPVRLDRKSLMALYMELDEERSASAIAANQAMAMITRLQAEKAAVQMEALQYQRMMEEQAEYDEEALGTASDMLLKKDEEIKELETELTIYREKYGGLEDDDFKEHKNVNNEDYQEMMYQAYTPHSHSSDDFSDDEDRKENGPNDHQPISIPEIIYRMKKDHETDMTGRGIEASLAGELTSLTERMKAFKPDNEF